MTKLRTKKTSTTKRVLIFVSILLFVVFSIRYYRINKSNPASINVTTSVVYGSVEITGNLFKETPVGVPGAYLLVSLTGDVAELEVPTNLDKLIGQPVIVQGELIPPRTNGGQPILIVTSITVKP